MMPSHGRVFRHLLCHTLPRGHPACSVTPRQWRESVRETDQSMKAERRRERRKQEGKASPKGKGTRAGEGHGKDRRGLCTCAYTTRGVDSAPCYAYQCKLVSAKSHGQPRVSGSLQLCLHLSTPTPRTADSQQRSLWSTFIESVLVNKIGAIRACAGHLLEVCSSVQFGAGVGRVLGKAIPSWCKRTLQDHLRLPSPKCPL